MTIEQYSDSSLLYLLSELDREFGVVLCHQEGADQTFLAAAYQYENWLDQFSTTLLADDMVIDNLPDVEESLAGSILARETAEYAPGKGASYFYLVTGRHVVVVNFERPQPVQIIPLAAVERLFRIGEEHTS